MKFKDGKAPGPSKSVGKNKPSPRGIKQKVDSALQRRRDQYIAINPSGQKCHLPGSQNRKKGASIK